MRLDDVRNLVYAFTAALVVVCSLPVAASADAGAVIAERLASTADVEMTFEATHQCAEYECSWFATAAAYRAGEACPPKMDIHHSVWVQGSAPRTGSGTVRERLRTTLPPGVGTEIVVCFYVHEISETLVAVSPALALESLPFGQTNPPSFPSHPGRNCGTVKSPAAFTELVVVRHSHLSCGSARGLIIRYYAGNTHPRRGWKCSFPKKPDYVAAECTDARHEVIETIIGLNE
jgi:hypothetical protein